MVYAIIITSTTSSYKYHGPVVECYTHETGMMHMAALSKMLTRNGWPEHDIRQYGSTGKIELEITDEDYLGNSSGKMHYLVRFQPVLEHVEVLE
jgi:hypothetical protein